MTNNIYKTKFQRFIEFLFVLFTILQCNSIFLYKVGHYKLLINLTWQLLLIALFMYICRNFKYINNDQILLGFIMLFTFIILAFLIIELVYYPAFHKSYIYRLLIDPIILIMYLCVFDKSAYKNSIFYILEDIIIFLSIISLIFWIMSVSGINTNTSIFVSGWYQSNSITQIPSYFNIGFIIPGSKAKFLGFNIIRNTGIFTEPSMFSYSIEVAIVIDLFIRNNKIIINNKLIILFIAMLTTVSTTGIVFSTLAIFYKEVLLRKSYLYKYILIIMIPILFLFLKLVVFEKVKLGSDPNSSYAIRTNDIQAGIAAWKQHVLLGNGLGNMSAITRHIGSWRFLTGNTGISTGFTTILACGGIIFILFYILPLIFSFIVSPNVIGFALFIILPIMFVSIQDSYMCILCLSYIWSKYIYHKNMQFNIKMNNDILNR